MLVLTRKVGEVIHIGPDIVVTVLEMREGRVRLGISAPKETPVYRKEIFDRIQESKNATDSNQSPAPGKSITGS
mgnify:CR=1 FL=1